MDRISAPASQTAGSSVVSEPFKLLILAVSADPGRRGVIVMADLSEVCPIHYVPGACITFRTYLSKVFDNFTNAFRHIDPRFVLIGPRLHRVSVRWKS